MDTSAVVPPPSASLMDSQSIAIYWDCYYLRAEIETLWKTHALRQRTLGDLTEWLTYKECTRQWPNLAPDRQLSAFKAWTK